MKKILGIVCTLFCVLCVITAADHTYDVHALTEGEAAWVDEARGMLREIVEAREIMALVYLEDAYQVRSEADMASAVVATVYSGHTVYIEDVTIDDNYEAWAYVRFFSGGQERHGYVTRRNLACSDERFLEWESKCRMNVGAAARYTMERIPDDLTVSGGDAVKYINGIDQFPESYQTALKALVDEYPEAANWTFVKQVTNLDWNTVINNELQKDRSWVPASWAAYMREGATKDSGWHYASRDILEYYMDPRNGLTMDGIFQFEQLTYNESCHTYKALQTFLDTTFMNSNNPAPGMDSMTYADIFYMVGKDPIRQVSPFHLAVRVLQEQGQGTSPLISGTYPGYENLYNYFNVQATGADDEIVVKGLTYAANGKIRVLNETTGQLEWVPQPWNNAYYSILGGADVVTANYIQKGQDTIYLQKFNVGPESQYAHYTHQYMQNIAAPTSEAKNTKKFYTSAEALDYPFVFKIPVYENMPEAASEKPESSTNVVIKVPEGYDGNVIYLDNQAYTPETRNGFHIVTAAGSEAKTAAVLKYNEKNVPIGMSIWTLEYINGAYTATVQPDLADLPNYQGFFFGENGKLLTKLDGLVNVNGSIYYFEDGRMTYAGLIKIGDYYYYINSRYQAATGRYHVSKPNGLMSEGYYDFDETGKMLNPFAPIVSGDLEVTPMYRVYNPNSGEHFYTGSVEERDNLVNAGWQYEGVAWNAPVSGGTPIYRLYNPNSGDHHYTGSIEERDYLVSLGWLDEGVAWNTFGENDCPQFRLYNPNADVGSHHYTGSIEERDYLVSLGWHYEGIAWYGSR